MYIYVLKLNDNKFFINTCNTPYFDIKNVFNYTNSSWIKKYTPEKLIDFYEYTEDTVHVNVLTLKYMGKFGIENVRGGCFSSFKLSDNDLYTINVLNNDTNKNIKCSRCSRFGHDHEMCNELYYPNSEYIYNAPKESYIECISTSSDISVEKDYDISEKKNEKKSLIKKNKKNKKKIKKKQKNFCCFIL